jgi:iron complex outermembrane recepter protein
MMIRHYRRALLRGAAPLAVCFGFVAAVPTKAEAAAGPDDSVAEVVVTVRRVAEPLQEAPASVSALSADALEKSGATTLNDVGKLVPNLNFFSSYRAGAADISLRGIPGAPLGGDPPVAVLVDGVQAPSMEFMNINLLDIQDVEVLRGPQGALYGRGALAGAVLINTRTPTDEVRNDGVFDAGNGRYFYAADTLSGPIVAGQLWGKISGSVKWFGGLIDNPGTGKTADSSRQRSIRPDLLWKPNEATSVELHADFTSGTDGSILGSLVPVAQLNNFSGPLVNTNIDTADHHQTVAVWLKITETLAIGQLTSISQYGYANSKDVGDADFSPLPLVVVYNPIKVKAFNQDLRFSTPDNQPLQWTVGGFFQRREIPNLFVLTGDPTGPLAGLPIQTSNELDRSIAYAAYTTLAARLPLGFRLSGSLRYDQDRRYDVDYDVPGSQIRKTFGRLQPQVTLNRQITPDVMAYATFGEGFVSGGFNSYLDAALGNGVPREFGQEVSKNYEIGLKSQLFERRLTLNVAGFYNDLSNEQYVHFNLNPPGRDVFAIPETHIAGGEVELALRATHDLDITGGVGINHATIEQSGLGGIYNGNRGPMAYDSTVNVALDYHHALVADWIGDARLEYQRFGSIYWDAANTLKSDPTHYVNLRLQATHDHYSIALWGKNLNDQRAVTTASTAAVNEIYRVVNQPRTFGLELAVHY